MRAELLSLIAIFASSAIFLFVRVRLAQSGRGHWRWCSRLALGAACLVPGAILIGLINLSPRRFFGEPANLPLALAMGSWLIILYIIDRYHRVDRREGS